MNAAMPIEEAALHLEVGKRRIIQDGDLGDVQVQPGSPGKRHKHIDHRPEAGEDIQERRRKVARECSHGSLGLGVTGAERPYHKVEQNRPKRP